MSLPHIYGGIIPPDSLICPFRIAHFAVLYQATRISCSVLGTTKTSRTEPQSDFGGHACTGNKMKSVRRVAPTASRSSELSLNCHHLLLEPAMANTRGRHQPPHRQKHGALCGTSQTERSWRSSFILLVSIRPLVRPHLLGAIVPCSSFTARRGGSPMPLDSLEFRTSLQKLLVGLILILVPLTVFGFYVAMQGDGHIRQAKNRERNKNQN